MRLSLSDDNGELKELGEGTKAAHLLVKAVKTPQVNKFTNILMKKSLPFYNTIMCQNLVDAIFQLIVMYEV